MKKKLLAILLLLPGLIVCGQAAVAAPISFTFAEFRADVYDGFIGFSNQTTSSQPATASAGSEFAMASATSVTSYANDIPIIFIPWATASTTLRFEGTFPNYSSNSAGKFCFILLE